VIQATLAAASAASAPATASTTSTQLGEACDFRNLVIVKTRIMHGCFERGTGCVDCAHVTGGACLANKDSDGLQGFALAVCLESKPRNGVDHHIPELAERAKGAHGFIKLLTVEHIAKAVVKRVPVLGSERDELVAHRCESPLAATPASHLRKKIPLIRGHSHPGLCVGLCNGVNGVLVIHMQRGCDGLDLQFPRCLCLVFGELDAPAAKTATTPRLGEYGRRDEEQAGKKTCEGVCTIHDLILLLLATPPGIAAECLQLHKWSLLLKPMKGSNVATI